MEMYAMEVAKVTRMVDKIHSTPFGERMAITAACRATGCSRDQVTDSEEAAGLLVDHDWTWSDVLTALS